MARVKAYVNQASGEIGCYSVQCPACNREHPFDVKRWTYNGNMDKPTFSPSMLVLDMPYFPRCHSFVRDGKIEYLSDCGHAMAGQTVDLPDID